MFAIGDREWPGISKLVEEIGELGQVCGKLMGTRGGTKHWNVPDLKRALEEEIADVLAACHFVIEFCGLDRELVKARAQAKAMTFIGWHTEDPEGK